MLTLCITWPQEFDCNLTREIVELVDREADLLNRGRSPKTMEGLRQRISSLFLAFIETPEFNVSPFSMPLFLHCGSCEQRRQDMALGCWLSRSVFCCIAAGGRAIPSGAP